MSVDFTWTDPNFKQEKVSLSYNEFSKLTPYFEELEKKVGLLIDGYSDFKFSPAHIALLLNKMEKDIAALQKSSNIKHLISMLQDAVKNSQWIFITGD